MKLTRRAKPAEVLPTAVVETDVEEQRVSAPKGRPTPKRRDAEGRRGPVTAPKTRKEAYARQKQMAKAPRPAKSAAPAKPRSVAEQRAALKRGDESALPRRDQGKTRKLARDYVDSKRMLSNYLLVLFPIMIAGSFVPALAAIQLVVLGVFLGLLVEWFITGRRIRAMAIDRFGKADGSDMSIGFYAGSRAYLPRRWRLPGPQVARGEDF
ncbi:MAG: DUF3043 domain-containing protein [Jatrophihabitans sp.]